MAEPLAKAATQSETRAWIIGQGSFPLIGCWFKRKCPFLNFEEGALRGLFTRFLFGHQIDFRSNC